MLSPNWAHLWAPASAPAEYNDTETTKVAVLMTDGEYNTWYKDENGNASAQARAVCEEMKSNGITVYTVGFMLNNADAIDTLSDCATDSSSAFVADNGDELRQAFRDIGMRLQKLRLSK